MPSTAAHSGRRLAPGMSIIVGTDQISGRRVPRGGTPRVGPCSPTCSARELPLASSSVKPGRAHVAVSVDSHDPNRRRFGLSFLALGTGLSIFGFTSLRTGFAAAPNLRPGTSSAVMAPSFFSSRTSSLTCLGNHHSGLTAACRSCHRSGRRESRFSIQSRRGRRSGSGLIRNC